MHDRIVLIILQNDLFPVYIEPELPDRSPYKFRISLWLQDQFAKIESLLRFSQEDLAHDPAAHTGDHQTLGFSRKIGVKPVGEAKLHFI